MRDLCLNDLYRYDYDAGIVQRLVYQFSKLMVRYRNSSSAPRVVSPLVKRGYLESSNKLSASYLRRKWGPFRGRQGKLALRDSDLLSIVSGTNSQTVESILRKFEAFSALSPGR